MGKRLTELSPLQPSPPSEADEIVELLPPKELGFSGTARLLKVEQATLIDALLARGYTTVTHARD